MSTVMDRRLADLIAMLPNAQQRARADNTLSNNGIDTLEKLRALSEKDLLGMRHLGSVTISSLLAALSSLQPQWRPFELCKEDE